MSGPYNGTDLDLSGKRALITGASRGIGEAIAERLAQAGASIALVSRRKESLEEVASRLSTETLIVPCNMSDSSQVADIVPEVIRSWGGVDILVNNAAANPVFGPLTDLEEKAWDKVMDTNVRGPFVLSQYAARVMADAGTGSIINIASIGGLEPSPMVGAYCISKAALISMTKAFAMELGPRGVRVNAIAPGLVETKFADVLINTPAIHEASVSRAALGRHAQPEEIAGAAHYLASESSSYMTGQVMVIDGGTRY